MPVSESEYIVRIILSLIGIVILSGLVGRMISRKRKKREALSFQAISQNQLPFPSQQILPAGILMPDHLEQAELDAQVIAAYQDWQRDYVLETLDPGMASIKAGVGRHRLGYQFNTTSLTQGLGMWVFTLMAGAEPYAQARFERLLAFSLARPSHDDENLSSWSTMPDVPSAPRLEADPQGDGWISFSILAGSRQWQGSSRFNYQDLLEKRISALLAYWQNLQAPQEQVYSPFFCTIFGALTAQTGWQKICPVGQDLKEIKALLTENEGDLHVDTSAWRALSLLQIGLASLAGNNNSISPKIIEGSIRSTVTQLSHRLEETADLEDGSLSCLALLACLSAAVMSLGDQALVNRYWQALAEVKPKKNDGVGASLRLIALIILSGNAWL